MDGEAPTTLTIVNGANGTDRVEARVVRIDDAWVVVRVGEVERRFSRRTGFEHPSGGSWSAWRLSGADHRKLSSKKDAQ